MARKQKPKRKKQYVPKHTRVLAAFAPFMPEFSEKTRNELYLAQLLPIRSLLAGGATPDVVQNAFAPLCLGAVIEEHFESEKGILDLCRLGVAGLLLVSASELVENDIPIPECLLRPAEAAVQRIVEIEQAMDRPALAFLLEQAQVRTSPFLGVEVKQCGILLQSDICRDRCMGRKGFAFINGDAVRGELADVDGTLFWEDRERVRHEFGEQALVYFGD